MASTTSKMALVVWDKLSDVFAHDTIRQNLLKIDVHDHTVGKGTQISSAGIKDGAITNIKLAAGVGDTAYREVAMGRAYANASNGSTEGPLAPSNPPALPQTGEAGVFYFDPADWGVSAGQTGKLRFTGHVASNSVNPATYFVFSLHPVTSHTNGTLTKGASLGSSGQIALGANAISSTFVVSSIVVPPAGLYVMYCTFGALLPASSTVAFYSRLLIRNG